MTSLEKDIRIAELTSEVSSLKEQINIYKNRLALLENGDCPKCKELETLVRQLKYQNTELRFALKNPRNAGRKRSITDDVISKIGKDRLRGMNARELADKYNISKSTIYRIINATDTYLIKPDEETSNEEE